MMCVVDRITIDEFRGKSGSITLDLDESVNFIIGRNGTGKTSLINIINWALDGDTTNLVFSHFSRIEIRLSRKDSRKVPVVTYYRLFDEEINEFYIEYSIRGKASEKEDRIRAGRDDRWVWHNNAYVTVSPKRRIRRHYPTVAEEQGNPRYELEQLIDKTWLSIHRGAPLEKRDAERRFETPIDQKLSSVFREFGTFFSTLDRSSATETDRFQTLYFLSLISPPKFEAIAKHLGEVDPKSERIALQEMFSEFGLKPTAFSGKLDSFVKRVGKAIQEYEAETPVPADTFLTITDAVRIHELVAEWSELIARRSEIYSPKSDFLKTVNRLFYDKELIISPGNEPVFNDKNGVEIESKYLSSGEKQMLILLGESLLQKKKRYIYLADEPELSLHIDWQEKLVPSLMAINPNAQIIFATHSPDIVGAFKENAYDLEKLSI